MRSIKTMVMLLVLFILPLPVYADQQGFARLSLTEGDVQIRVADTDDWLPAAVNTPLYEGDSVWTPAGSRTELQLQDGSVIRLDARSSLSILKVDDEYLQFHLGMGRIYVRTGENQRWDMQVDLTGSSVKIYDKSRLRIEVDERGEEEISVFRGTAYVESYGGRTKVRKGETLSVEDSRAEISPTNPPDAWDRWNTVRDGRPARRGGAGRLPEELAVYEEELSASGEWIESREYGYVWRPAVVAAPDWAPYRSGRWVWRGGDYVWISSEPWGWAPYHYGRWAVVAGFGWCWIPPLRGDVFWAPAYVGWISTPAHVGWVPLAPGETYYGRGYYGRHSVNVINVTVNQTTNIYRYANVSNAVTVVNRDSFISGKGKYRKYDAASFSREKAVTGRPEPRPHVKEVLMPQVRKLPDSKLPPPGIAKLPVRELKERFPKIDRGAEVVSRRDRQRPEAGQAARNSKSGTTPPPGMTAPAATRGKTDSPALVKPAVQSSRYPQPPEREPMPAERKPLRVESARPPVAETSAAGRGAGTSAAEARPAAPSAVRQPEAAAEQRSAGGGRRAPSGELPSQGKKAPENVQAQKEAVRKAAPPRERKAMNVWKIKPQEDAQPVKEKNK
jgi:hypothetical protein